MTKINQSINQSKGEYPGGPDFISWRAWTAGLSLSREKDTEFHLWTKSFVPCLESQPALALQTCAASSPQLSKSIPCNKSLIYTHTQVCITSVHIYIYMS